MRGKLLILAISLLSGCSSFLPQLPRDVSEQASGYTYIPLDPLPVLTVAGRSCGENFNNSEVFDITLEKGVALKNILDALPDNAVRMAIKEYNGNGKLSFGASSVGSEGSRYQVVLDYINVDSTNIRFSITYGSGGSVVVNRIPDESEAKSWQTTLSQIPAATDPKSIFIVIPVYVGVGLRLTADITVLKGTINLSSLGAIAAEVEGGKASGSLVVQTIGVTGKQVSVSLPLPSELNQTTVQTAILALGSIKAIIYDKESSLITPRVTGIYLPLPSGSEDLVNKIVSELARYPIRWHRGCQLQESTKVAPPT